MNDSGVSRVYSAAEEKKIPVKYLLALSTTIDTNDKEFVELLNVEDLKEEVKILSVFEVIASYAKRNYTLMEIYRILRKFPAYSPTEIPFMWWHALPQDIKDDKKRMENEYSDYRAETKSSSNFTQFQRDYEMSWTNVFQTEYEESSRMRREYLVIEKTLNNIKPVPYGPVTIDSITLSYTIRSDPLINELPDIFHAIVTSYDLPYAQYNASEESKLPPLYKIYYGVSGEAAPAYAKILPEEGKASSENTIYVQLWNLPGDALQASIRKNEFSLVTIRKIADTLRVTMTLPYRERKEREVITRLHNAIKIASFPEPSGSAIQTLKITGAFRLYGVNILPDVLLDLITNDVRFSTFLFVEENARSFAERRKISIGFYGAGLATRERTRSVVTCTLTQGNIDTNETFLVIDEKGEVKEKRSDQVRPYILVSLTKGSTEAAVQRFQRTIARLMAEYLNGAETRRIRDMYRTIFPRHAELERYQVQNELAVKGTRIQPVSDVKLIRPTVDKKGKILPRFLDPKQDRNSDLRKYAGELFVKGVARKCQKSHQPILINANEIKVWENRLVDGKKRQVLQYPRKNPRWTFVCPTDELPYLQMKENKTSSGDKFPYFPCCGSTHPLRNARGKAAWEGYLAWAPRTVSAASSGHIHSTNILLADGKPGLIETIMDTFLRTYREEKGERSFIRIGTIRSPNSFLHCVCAAVDRNYEQVKTDEGKEEYVINIRKKLLDKVHVDVVRQEFFDFTPEEITDYFTNEKLFFDPLYAYRAVEERFRVNIFVFSLEEKAREEEIIRHQASFLKLPRHRLFYVSPYHPHKRTLIVLRYWGSNSNNLFYPQCELIVERVGNLTHQYFEESMYRLLYGALMYQAQTLTWTIENDAVVTRLNTYSLLNYEQLFRSFTFEGQIIDGSGKARVFLLTSGETTIYVQVLPTQPLNRPSIDIQKELIPHRNTITQIFGLPSRVSVDPHGHVVGLWYTLHDIPNALLFPCKRAYLTNFPGIPTTPEISPFFPQVGLSQMDRVHELKRSSDILQQILTYLYVLYKHEKGRSVRDFRNKYIREIKAGEGKEPEGKVEITEREESKLRETKEREVKGIPEDTLVYYNMDAVPRILPAGSLAEVLAALSASPIPFIYDNKIVVTEDIGRIFRYNLEQLDAAIAGEVINPTLYRTMERYFVRPTDYSQQPLLEFVIEGDAQFHRWKNVYVPSNNENQRSIQNLHLNVQTRLNNDMFIHLEPFVYRYNRTATIGPTLDKNRENYFLIQNVHRGSFLRAINVANTWRMTKHNLGAGAPELMLQNGRGPPYRIFTISNEGTLLLPQYTDELFILRFEHTRNYYAAILPLLA